MEDNVKVLITGATGYIGSSVLARLLSHPKSASYNITALVRSAEKAKKLNALDVNTVICSHADLELIEKLASEPDIIISMAEMSTMEVTQAFLKGFKKHHEVTGVKSIFIRTSGTGVLVDDAQGDCVSTKIYRDTDLEPMETIPPTFKHRGIDLAAIKADSEGGYVKTYIVFAPTVYGLAKNKLVEQGISKHISKQIPLLVTFALKRGQGGMIGMGKNVWANVHIDDLADLYIALFDSILSDSAKGNGKEGIYFAENGEHSLYEVANAISQALVKLGLGKSEEPTTFTSEEVDRYFGKSVNVFATNSRCRGERSRSIGWAPKWTTKDMLQGIKSEVEEVIKLST